MTLWIDADAAPQPVKEICLRASERLKLATVLVANQRLQVPPGYANVSAVRVDGGADSVGNDRRSRADGLAAALLHRRTSGGRVAHLAQSFRAEQLSRFGIDRIGLRADLSHDDCRDA